MSLFRELAFQLMEETVDPKVIATACLKYMSDAMIEEMLFSNQFIGFDEDE